MTRALLTNGRVLLDEGLRQDVGVLLEGARILDVVDSSDPRCRDAARVDLRQQLLLPGFIDVQVNGGGGVLFNDAPEVATIARIAQAHRRFGTTGFLPTLISAEPQTIRRAIAAVREAIAAGVPGVLGIHIEGPFLNVERKGVHDPARLRDLDASALELLTAPHGGRTVVTLAPEMTTPQIIRALSDAGVIVCAGHTNATYRQIRAALANGLAGFTHLFNAMSQLTGREPGTVGAALDDPGSWCGIIVDGAHTDPVVLRLALRCKPHERFMLVTDAMPTVGTPLDSFMLDGRRIGVHGTTCVDADGRLAGSNIDMASSVRNAMSMLGLSLPEAVRMASSVPAQFLRLGPRAGTIAAGERADLVLASDELGVLQTWIGGQPV
ncbi:MAG: N-acetylglucosamine-6-phosphate deacetylase [Proteobacteria bacterium]|nr:N-acetylglucosamine-6-phosphate deacetylase [Pseudomonadota bacterium]